jgi:16S rRNA (guanine(1405)-N(7))-methyltransferase
MSKKVSADMSAYKELIASVKSKKGLETLDDAFVQQKIEKIFNANNKLRKKFGESKDFRQFSRSSEYEELLKRIRKELRAVYGVFQAGGDRREILRMLRSAKSEERQKLVTGLLQLHTSTRERLPHYDEIYARICKLGPKTVVDLGCGMNPIAYNYFEKNGCRPKIFASDISKTDMGFLEECFKALDIPGRAKAMDLTKEYEELGKIKGDVTLMLKLLDSLEEAHRHISYKIFDNIKTPWIIASFPTRSLGGKKRIAAAGRTWFERLLKRKSLQWETFSVENELFYVIKNH